MEDVLRMIKMVANAKRGNRPLTVVLLGLSHQNLDRLKAGEPITVKGDDVHLPGAEIVIFSGKDERTMQREMQELIGPETDVRIDPRLGDA
jgi:hypothetical protein